MYKIHAVKCQQYAQRSANNMADVALMVSLSIQQNWLTVGDQLADVRKNKTDSKYLTWEMKRNTYEYLQANKHKMYAQAMAVINSKQSDTEKAQSLMKVFLRVTGLGLPKAGFMCQLMAGLVGVLRRDDFSRGWHFRPLLRNVAVVLFTASGELFVLYSAIV